MWRDDEVMKMEERVVSLYRGAWTWFQDRKVPGRMCCACGVDRHDRGLRIHVDIHIRHPAYLPMAKYPHRALDVPNRALSVPGIYRQVRGLDLMSCPLPDQLGLIDAAVTCIPVLAASSDNYTAYPWKYEGLSAAPSHYLHCAVKHPIP